jgi:hypothetical protein
MSQSQGGTRPATDDDVEFFVELPTYITDEQAAQEWLSNLAKALSFTDVAVVPSPDRPAPEAAADGSWFMIKILGHPICPGRIPPEIVGQAELHEAPE